MFGLHPGQTMKVGVKTFHLKPHKWKGRVWQGLWTPVQRLMALKGLTADLQVAIPRNTWCYPFCGDVPVSVSMKSALQVPQRCKRKLQHSWSWRWGYLLQLFDWSRPPEISINRAEKWVIRCVKGHREANLTFLRKTSTASLYQYAW